MIRNELSTATGNITITTRALRKCKRKARPHQRDYNAFFKQFFEQRIYCALNQCTAVIDNFVFQVRWQAFHGLSELLFRIEDDLPGIGAYRTTTMPPTVSPSPLSSAMPRRISGPNSTLAICPRRIGTPLSPTPNRDFSKILQFST
jgi:hypothetical protein